MNPVVLAAFCLLGACGTAWAIEPASPPAPRTQTEAWLQLQVRGEAASKTVQTATPTEREQSLQRWLDNYKHPIPEFYDQGAEGKVGSGK
ncbi:DUF3613 domain-containing protein [Pseudomonas syringae]|nr:DUF3613 domain-containing protein [Pseudomonas syringae]MBD8575462.1 DUF3613 domain-containing protein [Pseudomonas syringae]MBD8788759.1 DUF3613 domain-containing protein [Pseudomonas syringae]MBD8803930.1 DUF3613 domain-containing protein [Pseudomonas syringae]MBD8811238.1 DUF3613 domain-containing protein [Pseudomonas syringae]